MPRIPSAERREQLVQAALRVIAAHGVQAATTRAIVAEAGMSLASFHYAFRSHAEMMRELIAHVVGGQREAIAGALGPDLRTALRRGLQIYLETLIANPAHEQVLLELMQYALRTPGLEHLVREQWASYRDAARELAEHAARSSGTRWSIPLDDVARLLITVTDGVTLGWLADRDDAAAAATLDRAADALAALAEEPQKAAR